MVPLQVEDTGEGWAAQLGMVFLLGAGTEAAAAY